MCGDGVHHRAGARGPPAWSVPGFRGVKGIPEDMQAWQTGMAAWAAASLTLAIYTANKARDAFRMAREHEAKKKPL